MESQVQEKQTVPQNPSKTMQFLNKYKVWIIVIIILVIVALVWYFKYRKVPDSCPLPTPSFKDLNEAIPSVPDMNMFQTGSGINIRR